MATRSPPRDSADSYSCTSFDAPNSVQAQERNDDNDYRAAMESWQQQNYRENGAGVNCSAIRHHHKSGGHDSVQTNDQEYPQESIIDSEEEKAKEPVTASTTTSITSGSPLNPIVVEEEIKRGTKIVMSTINDMPNSEL